MPGPQDPAVPIDVPEGKAPSRLRRKFVLCFDGTGNKFQGNAGDSNILKIYSMLERTDKAQFHYYQPGIGTYSTSKTLSTSSTIARIKSWYAKAKDSAVGTTLDEHVMAGYRFLMRYYQDGDDIYFFGFSRGAYIARFLAELLDHVGLLSTGNEELVRFVWKTFARWQQRKGGNAEARDKEQELFNFMKAFRETFSRPVRRIRFLGLFDTVNSVSKFEIPWMQRSKKSPYTVHSSAIRICHAVSIDERRAKFRQDLILQKEEPQQNTGHFRRPSREVINGMLKGDRLSADLDPNPERFRSRSRGRSRSPGQKVSFTSIKSGTSADDSVDSADEDEEAPQSISELWFPGCHADIGGGWTPDPPHNLSLSHAPLVWMVREAQKAGLVFNTEKMRELNCYYDDTEAVPPQKSRGRIIQNTRLSVPGVPVIEVNDDAIEPVPHHRGNGTTQNIKDDEGSPLSRMIAGRSSETSKFFDYLHASCTRGKIHDPLQRNTGTPIPTVLQWNIMEYLPFRRMDLRPDGTWKVIWWPLPMGEVRDVPLNVKVHNSAIKRMRADENYRPGNLIIGGGGRGMRRAPEEVGIGEWVALEEGKGHPIDEVYIRGVAGMKEEIGWGKNS